MRRVIAVVALVIMGSFAACSDDTTSPTSCPNGPYQYDSNPSVQRCRASNGQFAPDACCGR